MTPNNIERIGKYLSVRKYPADPKRKTYRWTVMTNHGDTLGAVQWFPRWRQYCFDPRECTTFNDGCLRDLATFMERVNREYRASRTTENPATPDLARPRLRHGEPDPECERCGGTGSEFVEPGPDTKNLRGAVPCACRGH